MSDEIMSTVHIESLVLTLEGRRLLGQISAAEGLASLVGQHLAMLDISEEWRWDIESARLEKLRDMDVKDTDAKLLYKEADKIMQRHIANQTVSPDPKPVNPLPTPSLNVSDIPGLGS